MKTKYYFLAALAAVSLVSCSSDDFIADAPPADNSQEYGVPIMFSSLKKGMTRADFVGADAAALLNNKFVVSGYKGKQTDWDADNVMVFDNYIVTYAPNTAHTTESNSDNWEYVGNEPIDHAKTNGIVKQTIKYWDYNTDQYDFFAWAVGDGINPVFSGTPDYSNSEVLITAIDPENAVQVADDVDATHMAYSFTGTAADLTNCYISDLVTVLKKLPDGQANAGTNQVVGYNQPVTLKFRQLGAKVRMGIYETVPGYSVKNVKFYYAAKSDNVNDLGQEDPTLFTTTAGQIYNEGTYYIYFPTVDQPADADNNQAHIKFEGTPGDQVSNVDFDGLQYTIAELGEKGTNGDMNVYIGRSSNTASMAGQAQGNYYTQYLPNESGTNLNLRVNYTLEAIDGSGEIIEVKGATAQVPAIYTQWKAGYAYTYLFKISDKTNGYTGVYDPTNPDGNTTDDNPAGLYPITFDAVVVNAEDGDKTQETITLVSAPSITTYQKGSTVVNKNEYVASTGDIYVTVNDGEADANNPALANGKLQSLSGKASLYIITGGKTQTEAEVVDALTYREDDLPAGSASGTILGRNGLLLTPATIDLTNEVQFGVDGNVITVGDNEAAKFTPTGSTTYAFVYTKEAPQGHTTLFQPASFDNLDGKTKCRYDYAAADAGDVKAGTDYFTSDGTNYAKADVFLGQSATGLYVSSGGGVFNISTDEHVKTSRNYYYTENGGQSYEKVRKVAYEDFTTTVASGDVLFVKNGDDYTPVASTVTNPDMGTTYYKKEGNKYYLCLICPQQTTGLFVLTRTRVVADETTAVEGQTYFDRYYKYAGVYYSKVIKVQ